MYVPIEAHYLLRRCAKQRMVLCKQTHCFVERLHVERFLLRCGNLLIYVATPYVSWRKR